MNPPNMDKMIQEMLWHIDAACEKEGWDQDAQLYAVMLQSAEDIPLPEDTIAAGIVELRPVPGWDLCLEQTQHPKPALAALAFVMAKAPQELIHSTFPLDKLYGFFLITEAWMLRAKRNPTLDEELEHLSAMGHVSEHPNRIEVRFIYCVSMDGTVSALSHERDGIAEELGEATTTLDGDIPDLLNKVLKVVKQK